MNIKTPSGRVIPVIIVCALFIGGTIIIDSYLEKKQNVDEKKQQADFSLKITKNVSENLLDTDGDGLSDWEEILYETDPKNPDTDGDKTTDKEEILTGRNPKKMGPDDKISSEDSIPEIVANSKVGEDSLTSSISKQLFANYLQLNSQGSITTENQNKLATDLAKKASESINTTNRYNPDGIYTFSDSDKEKIKNYANQMAETQLEFFTKISDASKQNDGDFISSIYKNMSLQMSNLQVPQGLLETHAEIINNYYKLADAILAVSKLENDPIKSLLYFKQIQTLSEKQPALEQKIGTYLKQNDIIFSRDKEKGWIYIDNLKFNTTQTTN